MEKTFKKIALILMVLFFSISLVSATMAAPPPHARGGNNAERENGPPGLQDKGTPPGLVDKGGLPPGMHGRSVDELPPGIRYNPNFREAVERLKEEEKKEDPVFYITGSEYIVIPHEGTVTEPYLAVLRDEEDNEKEVDASWSLENGHEGVSIDEESGVLEVTAAAEEDSTVIVKASYTAGESDETVNYTATFEVTLYKQEAASVKIDGDKYILLDNEDEFLTLEYAAVVKDQNDQALEGKSVNWNITSENFEDYADFSYEGETVNVEIPAAEGTFTVTAATGEIISEPLVVTVYIPEISALKIDGDKYVALQGDEEEPLVLEYTAAVKDQNDQIMKDKDIVWFINFDNELWEIEFEEGVVNIAELPAQDQEITFTLTAMYVSGGSVVANDELEVVVYHPVLEDIIISGDAEITLPAAGEEVIAEYEAVAIDQHGQEIEKTVIWFLEEDITGVTLDDGTLTVTDEAEAGSFYLWVYAENLEEEFYGFEVFLLEDDKEEAE